jgi:stage II sporulation protein D
MFSSRENKRRRRTFAYKILALLITNLVLILFFFSCKTRVTIEPPNKTSNYALQHLLTVKLQEPTIRIELLPDINPLNISAEKGFYIINKNEQTYFHSKTVNKLVRIEVPGMYQSGPLKLYTIQVASLSDSAAAERSAEEIKKILDIAVSAHYNSSSGTYQVRAGRCTTRQEASLLAAKLNKLGYTDVWIATIERTPQHKSKMQLFYPSNGQVKETANALIIVPCSLHDVLKVNQQPYRGIIELFINSTGSLSVINELHIEDYLKGVVPCEMSPLIFNELEALKAQAVAARTYAIRNMGQFSSDGYDLCSTSRCQVYKGYSAEHPLSNRAVDETRGIVATYNGEPINALYTSTCGGHTENGENVFGGQSYPYLKGVKCYPESSTRQDYKSSTSIELIYAEDGGLVNEELALLVVSGIIPADLFTRKYLQEKTNAREIENWTMKALAFSGKKSSEHISPDNDLSLQENASFAWMIDYLIKAFGWRERAQLMISNSDTEYLLTDLQSTIEDSYSRRNIALLLQEGIIAPFPYGSIYADLVPTRALALRILVRLMGTCKPLPLIKGVFIESIENSLELKIGGKIESFSLDPAAYVFISYGDRIIPSRILRLIPGDKVTFHHTDKKIDFIKASANLAGLADDRFSPYYRWEVRLSRHELGERIREYLPIGELLDLKPIEEGVSNRIIKLAVEGSAGQFFLTGLKIRQLLGLRENLFLIEREYNQNNEISCFNFIGKGWGHGVGLCQVGSFGMALRGANFEEILKHYYSNIELNKNY